VDRYFNFKGIQIYVQFMMAKFTKEDAMVLVLLSVQQAQLFMLVNGIWEEYMEK
jgi:hypothetical protein